jgi:hypothetical protein
MSGFLGVRFGFCLQRKLGVSCTSECASLLQVLALRFRLMYSTHLSENNTTVRLT